MDATASKRRVDPATQIPNESCLSETICSLKSKLRWKTSAWSPGYCRLIARGVLDAAAQHDLPPALLLAVMINESDLNERAVNTTLKGQVVYAKDSGLMGVRCVLDEKERCTNGAVKGLAWKTLMDPLKNIEIGAGELARWRDGGGIAKVETRVRGADGTIVTKEKIVPCQHKTHAYWAHYNHGPRYIDHGHARHYPHRVAVFYHSLAKAMNLTAPELTSARVTIIDKGQRPRTADKPIGKRQRELVARIETTAAVCRQSVASLKPGN